MLASLRARPATWLLAITGGVVSLLALPSILQLRFSYYPNGLQGGLIKVDRLSGRMQECVPVGPYPQTIVCGPASRQ